ncbi:helix-turn-helix domain-containing protein [Cohnella lupini]|uniref:helix-turn-helix domain-containing protein n=1 Tax=Cohnella lupini TaxID=1294267 RepID=UPI000E236ADF
MQAQNKLKQSLTSELIMEIDIKVGFDSPTSFGRFFKRETNVTPQEYRGDE